MEINYLRNKLKQLTGLSSLEKYEEDIKKLVEAHNQKQFSVHARIKILSEQILLDLDDLFNRTVELLKYKKNSSSLYVYELRYGKEEGRKRHAEKTSKTKQTLKKYIEKYGEIDGELKYKEYCKSKSMSLEMFIRRYGEEDGKIKYREYWDTTGFGTSKRAFKKRHGDDWEIHYNNYVQNQGKNSTLEGKILKYGEEEGRRKYIELNMKKSQSLSKEKFIQKKLEEGCSFSEIQNAIIERWDNNSLKSFKSRYGEKDGEVKYNEYMKKFKESNPLCLEYYEKRDIPESVAFEMISNIQWERNKNVSRFSKESLKYLDALDSVFSERGFLCRYKEHELGLLLTKDEYDIYEKNRLFFYDFFVPDLNLIVEYHGVRFHDDIDYDKTLGVRREEVSKLPYNVDFYKKWIAEYRGYEVIILRSWNINQDLDSLFEFLHFTEEEKCKFL